MEKVLCVWGDSITMGARDLEKGGRVARLHNYVSNRFLRENGDYSVVYNLGIDGDTSTGKLKRFAVEAEAREPDTIIFATGANDCTYKADRIYTVPIDIFRKNMVSLIAQARKFTNEIIIVGLIPCDESKMIPIPRVAELSQDMEGIKTYNTILKEVAEQEKVLFIDMLDVVNENDLEDGCHPTAKGHEKMYIEIRDFLLEHKIL